MSLSLFFCTQFKWFQVLLRITNNSIKHQSFVYIQLNDQIVQFQTIQFSIKQFSSVLPMDSTLSGATTPDQSGPGSNGNEGDTPHSPKAQRFIRLFSVLSRTLIEWGRLPLCRDAVGVFYSHS